MYNTQHLLTCQHILLEKHGVVLSTPEEIDAVWECTATKDGVQVVTGRSDKADTAIQLCVNQFERM